MRSLGLLALLPAALLAQAPTHLNVPAKQLVTVTLARSGSERSADEVGGITLTKADGTTINWNAAGPASGQTLVILDLQAAGQRSLDEAGATADKTYRAVFTGYNTSSYSYPFYVYLPVTFPPLTTSYGSGLFTFPGGMAFAHPQYPLVRVAPGMDAASTRFFGHGYLVSSN